MMFNYYKMDILNIDILIVLISEYLGNGCRKFLQIMKVRKKKYKHLYTEYGGEGAKICPIKARYYIINKNFTNLCEYTNLISLTFGNGFDEPLRKNCLPINLTHLFFGRLFNRPIECDVLPQSLKTIKFGYYFNQPVKNICLPSSLMYLSFGNNFDQLIDNNFFPSSLLSLHFGWCFNQPITKNVLPINLKELYLGYRFQKPIISLPDFLEEIHIDNHYVYKNDLLKLVNEKKIKLILQ